MEALNCKLVLIYATLIAAVAAAAIIVDTSWDHHKHQILELIPTGSPCKSPVAECLAGEEFELDFEISQRMLATTMYISYCAL
ncbi:Protein RALF-like 1 [Hibiscus syriacus]|uniref:Protein RALF-like 1 n=1 Tax=Hibiscus syriacus TaxID=106335 RepID=A0A6A2YXA1_HIBSY|nr:Protein RALF-like 1 [Hibiscus syriacus]